MCTALVSASSLPFDASTAEGLSAHRSSSRPPPAAIEPRRLPQRSAQRSSANAPVGGLKPPPVGRLRRAKQPPSLLQHRNQRDSPSPNPPHLLRSCSQCKSGMLCCQHRRQN